MSAIPGCLDKAAVPPKLRPMSDFEPRRFATDAEIIHLGEGLLACRLGKEEWTHEAHLAASLYLLSERPDVDVDAEIGGIIARFNESVGTVNDDSGGYHATITRSYVAGIRAFLRCAQEETLVARVNALLASPAGRRDWPLRFYSKARLSSVAARRQFVEPDRAKLP
ncbi:hypothetical protein AB2M62_06870 [Sphingomonas sp. MMS12-HWE2-04]|uniref:hypothetical protein n=1 Tax=Sphingomonas sp. MMS12-HWE2-04 TaxID=3234199 RepID=UPI0038501261